MILVNFVVNVLQSGKEKCKHVTNELYFISMLVMNTESSIPVDFLALFDIENPITKQILPFMGGFKRKELLSESKIIRRPRNTPMNAVNISRRRGGFGFSLELKGGITDNDGHPKTGVCPRFKKQSKG